MFSLEGKNSIVTGGGSGIGRAIAEALATQGAVVDILEVDLDGAAETISAIEVFTKIFLFYAHERIWLGIRWGQKKH